MLPCVLAGSEHLQNDHGVIVDYNTADPLIRWDSYENLSADGEGAYVTSYLVVEEAQGGQLGHRSETSYNPSVPNFQRPEATHFV
jgi:hypothetical protein